MNTWLDENSTTVIDMALNTMENIDPSPNKQYVQWVVMRYLDGAFRLFEDVLSNGAEFLNKYHELKQRRQLPAEIADINRFKGAETFSRLFLRVNTLYDEFKVAQDEKEGTQLSKGNSKVVLDNKEVRVIVPENEQAACYYGQGTAWCTASTTSTNYFNHYNDDGPMYILIPKNAKHEGEKYQLHFESGQYMDEGDSPINLQKLFAERFTDPSTFNFFDEMGSLSQMIVFADDQVFEDIVKAIKVQVNEFLYEEISEWEIQDDYYYTWLRDEGHATEDGDIEDDAPSYLEYNDEASRTIDAVLYEVDITKEDVSEWDTYRDDEETYTLKELPYVVASILRDNEARNEGFRGHIADRIEKHLSLDVTQGKDSKRPADWALYFEWKSMKDGRTKWNKSKVQEKSYVN